MNNKKKILIIGSANLPIPPVKGGAVENLLNFFLEFNDANDYYDIDVVSISDVEASKSQYKKSNVIYLDLNSIRRQFEKVIRFLINKLTNKYIGNMFLSQLIKKEKKNLKNYDLIVVENSPEYGQILSKLTDTKLVLHLHNDYLNKETKNAINIFNSYDEIFTLSKFVKNKVDSIDPSNIKTKVLYNGIDILNFHKNKENIRTINYKSHSYNFSSEDKIVMFSGRLVPEKGIKELIIAMLPIMKKDKRVYLVVIGGKSYSSNINSKYIKELKKIIDNNEQIIMLGYVPYSLVPQIVNSADIGVIPSVDSDGFNLTTVEYLAASIPVIVSDKGGMQEVINQNSGIVVKYSNNFINDLSEAIKDLIYDEEKYNFMKKNTFERSLLFSKEEFCNNFSKLIDESVKKNE